VPRDTDSRRGTRRVCDPFPADQEGQEEEADEVSEDRKRERGLSRRRGLGIVGREGRERKERVDEEGIRMACGNRRASMFVRE
jgi:hypothetical protein